jgi:hypothetical protein
MSAPGHTIDTSSGVANPYTQAFQRKLGCRGISTSSNEAFDEFLGQCVPCTRSLMPQQLNKRLRAAPHASAISLERSRSLNAGVATFVAANTPTGGDLVGFSQRCPGAPKHPPLQENSPASNPVSLACTNLATRTSVHQEYAAMEADGVYGRISCNKPDKLSVWCTRTFLAYATFLRSLNTTRRSVNSIS